MSIQAIFNEQAISMMPLISAAIDSADSFSANQMKFRALLELSNFPGFYLEATEDNKRMFQVRIIQIFKDKGWLDINA